MRGNKLMQNEYVTLVVPCYNVAKTLQMFLDSVFQQTYPYIQIILINDGSTDQTEEILIRNKSKFEGRGIHYTYVYQDNAGLGAAINTGLKYIEGDYLCWADPDDFLMETSIEKRVKILRTHPDYGAVSSDAYYYREDDLNCPIGRASDGLEHCFEPNQFEYLLIEKSLFCPGCHMLRMSAFDQVNPRREIYPARRGQNWQLLLPVYYNYKRYYLDEPLYGYVVYSQSMSRGDTSEEKVMQRWKEHETIIIETLKNMELSQTEREKYVHLIKTRYAKKRFYTAIDYKDKKRISKEYQYIEDMKESSKEIRKLYFRNKFLICKVILKLQEKIV